MTEPFNLDIPKMGYNLLVRHEGGLFGDLIYKSQKQDGFSDEYSRYTHVETLFGGPWSVRVAPPKIKVDNFLHAYTGRYVKIVRYKNHPDFENHLRYKIAGWAASNCNRDYDWWGVMRFKVGWLFHKKNSYFCSENSLWALQKECPGALGIKPENCMPAHFLNPKVFELIWEGYLS